MIEPDWQGVLDALRLVIAAREGEPVPLGPDGPDPATLRGIRAHVADALARVDLKGWRADFERRIDEKGRIVLLVGFYPPEGVEAERREAPLFWMPRAVSGLTLPPVPTERPIPDPPRLPPRDVCPCCGRPDQAGLRLTIRSGSRG